MVEKHSFDSSHRPVRIDQGQNMLPVTCPTCQFPVALLAHLNRNDTTCMLRSVLVYRSYEKVNSGSRLHSVLSFLGLASPGNHNHVRFAAKCSHRSSIVCLYDSTLTIRGGTPILCFPLGAGNPWYATECLLLIIVHFSKVATYLGGWSRF